MNFDSSFVTCSCSNGNENDYETLLKMMRKFNMPIVTVHNGNAKCIISFGVHDTIEYVFKENALFDVITSKISFVEWISKTFLLSKGDGSTITIYNR